VKTEGGTHLNCAALPGEDRHLTFVAENIVFTLSKLCAKNFSVPFQDLMGFSFLFSHHRTLFV
jgi:hypothetical protein